MARLPKTDHGIGSCHQYALDQRDAILADLNEALALLRNCNPEGEEEWRERRDLLLAKHDAKEGT